MALPRNMSQDQLYRFIGGRRHYNSWRKFQAHYRRRELMLVWASHPNWRKADLARHFGVSRATITRDVRYLKHHRRNDLCPLCNGRGKVSDTMSIAAVMEIISQDKNDYERLAERLKRVIEDQKCTD